MSQRPVPRHFNSSKVNDLVKCLFAIYNPNNTIGVSTRNSRRLFFCKQSLSTDLHQLVVHFRFRKFRKMFKYRDDDFANKFSCGQFLDYLCNNFCGHVPFSNSIRLDSLSSLCSVLSKKYEMTAWTTEINPPSIVAATVSIAGSIALKKIKINKHEKIKRTKNASMNRIHNRWLLSVSVATDSFQLSSYVLQLSFVLS